MATLSIWNPEYVVAAQALLPYCLWGIAVFVCFAKLSEPYQFGHLCCGLFLIFFGMLSLELVFASKEHLSIMLDAKNISKDAKEFGSLRWDIFQISVPALSFSFGTRFVGNWVTAKRPAKRT